LVEKAALSPQAFSHFDKHLLHVGKSERFFPRPLQFLESVDLLYCDGVTLDMVGLVEVSEQGASDGGRKIQGFWRLHAAVTIRAVLLSDQSHNRSFDDISVSAIVW
jgi:hypothetical protein